MQLLALPQKCTCRYAKSWPLSTRLKQHSLTNNGYLQFSLFSLNQTQSTNTDQQGLPSILTLLIEPDPKHKHWPTRATFNSHSSHWTRPKAQTLTNMGYLQFSLFSLNQTQSTNTDQHGLPSILTLLIEPDPKHKHWPTMATFNSHSSHWTRPKAQTLTNKGYLQFSLFSLNQTQSTNADQQWLPSILTLLTEPKPCIEKYPPATPTITLAIHYGTPHCLYYGISLCATEWYTTVHNDMAYHSVQYCVTPCCWLYNSTNTLAYHTVYYHAISHCVMAWHTAWCNGTSCCVIPWHITMCNIMAYYTT